MENNLQDKDEPRRKKPFVVSLLPDTGDPFSFAQKEKGTVLFRADEAEVSKRSVAQSRTLSADDNEDQGKAEVFTAQLISSSDDSGEAKSTNTLQTPECMTSSTTSMNRPSCPGTEDSRHIPIATTATSSTSSNVEKFSCCEMEERGTSAAPTAAGGVSKQRMSRNCILVNPCQRGNPVLRHIRNVPWEYDSAVVPDYVLGQTSCGLFLSIHYHLLHPNYIYQRLKRLGRNFTLRLLLVLVDMKDSKASIQQLTKVAILAECTLILAWSSAEAARYLETYKAYENKPPDLLKERVGGDYMSRLTDCLTTVRSINKTDVVTLSSNFETLDKIMEATPERLALCPGFGQKKAHQLHRLFRQSFYLNKHNASRVAASFTSRMGTASNRADGDVDDMAGVEVAELLQDTNMEDIFGDNDDGNLLDEEV